MSNDPKSESTTKPRPYQFFMLGVCLYSVIMLAYQTIFRPAEPVVKILRYVDLVVCCVFMGDFILSLVTARNKLRYLYTWGWIDLVSSIPAVGILRWGRMARILRISRLFRGVRSTKMLAAFILERRAEGAFQAAAFLSLLLVVMCSIFILQFEIGAGGNIKTPEDALWWAAVTITTAGYGDRYPVTTEGQIIATILMTTGVGLYGTFAGLMASWFLTPVRKQEASELEHIRSELQEIKSMLQDQKTSRSA